MRVLALLFTQAIGDIPSSVQSYLRKEVAVVCQKKMLHLKGLPGLSALIQCREMMKHFWSLAIFHLQIGRVLSQGRNNLSKKGLLTKSFLLVMIGGKKIKQK